MPPNDPGGAGETLLQFPDVSSDIGLVKRPKAVGLSPVIAAVLVVEFFAVAASSFAASTIYHYAVFHTLAPFGAYVLAAIYTASLVLLISIGFRHYSAIRRRSLHAFLWNGVGTVALAFSFLLSTMFLLKVAEAYSRGTFVSQLVGVCAAVCLTRAFFYWWLQSALRAGKIEARRVVVIGDEHGNWPFQEMVGTEGIRRVASLPFPVDSELQGSLGDQSVRGVVESCRRILPDDIVILSPQQRLNTATTLSRLFAETPSNVHIVPVGHVNIFASLEVAELGNLKTLQTSKSPLSTTDQVIKRIFDIAAAAFGRIILSPLFQIVALAIKLDSPGRVFYRQTRHGYNNREIRIFKFRSMTESNEYASFSQATRNDARVTRVGQVLRRASIDELPQLLNVLMGDMSIVGPRPHATAHNKQFEEEIMPFFRRHNMKPGITGWAQINGYRGETDTLEKMQRRVEHDLYYVDHWSFLFDLKIIFLTLFSKRPYVNAY